MRTELRGHGATLKAHSTLLKAHSQILHDHSRTLQELQQEQRCQGVLLEDLQGDMSTVLEMLSDNLKVQAQVTKHDQRIDMVEINQQLMTLTLGDHTRQLKTS